jgi:hypothetical protein
MITAKIKGDKFTREISKMNTGDATRGHLEAQGFDGQIYMATRKSQRGGKDMAAMVYRVKATGEYVTAL